MQFVLNVCLLKGEQGYVEVLQGWGGRSGDKATSVEREGQRHGGLPLCASVVGSSNQHRSALRGGHGPPCPLWQWHGVRAVPRTRTAAWLGVGMSGCYSAESSD